MTDYNHLPQDLQLWRRQADTSTSTLILTLTLTALVTQSDLRTQTIIFTSVITEIETITNNNQIKTSTAVQAIPTLADSDATNSRATSLTSEILSPTASSSPARLPVSSASSVIQRTQSATATFAGIPTPTNIPATSTSLPIDSISSQTLSSNFNTIAPSLQSSPPITKSTSNNNQNKIAIPAIVISVTLAIAFMIICISYFVPRFRNQQKTKQSAQMFDEYSKLAKTFNSSPSHTTLDYSQAYIPKNSIQRNKGKSRMIENLDQPSFGVGDGGFKHVEPVEGHGTWSPQSPDGTEPSGPIV
ncbi:uncharacterized protein MELLADRAFT_115437 [Melampsora larici-populina 98AG31]|uniref:Uncharacterized protein n=1 Tax=Melampsora larici-populina (strain 98AG31 / pathotype 3-4-7) TaxID=747676 RepID=F4RAI6_MELLP|nr:uncharacterized protein MELLADRAFT_115437 [Melampsora larici-populina 98AG31]EGG10485.1 hypothetical protein MELLADRAFT_115437 [Melampsora larici-populina 98AG31]